MTKIIKNSFGSFLVVLLIFSIVTGWIFSGWPQVWKKPSIPPEIQKVFAATEVKKPTAYTLDSGTAYSNPGYAYDFPDTAGDESTNADQYSGVTGISRWHTWATKGQTYTTTVLKVKWDTSGGFLDDHFAIEATKDGTNWNLTLVADGVHNETTIQTAQVSLDANQDLTLVEVRVNFVKVGGGDKDYIYIHDIWTEGEYTAVTYPSFDSGQEPHEDPASNNGAGTGGTADNPVNVGSNVTFKATATDPQSDDWTLLVCKTDGVTGIACNGGGSDTYCTSSSTTSASEANCTYTALVGDTESNAWYAYACDASSCSANSNSGNGGNTGTPFYVNHAPAFSVYSMTDNTIDPGGSAEWTTTSSDTDSDAAADTVTLYVCTTQAFTGGGTPACTVSEWCHDTSPGTTNSSCTYAVPNPRPDEDVNAYGYIVDNHGLVSGGASQGTNAALTINNVAPTIAAANIVLKDTDGSGNLQLTVEEGLTQDFYVEFVVADNNSCENSVAGDEIASAIVHVRMSELAQSACDTDGEDNANNCAANAHADTGGQCIEDLGVNACSGTSDSDVGWKCEFPLQYHADPTIAGDYPKAAFIWLAAVQATDDDSSASSLVDDADGTEMDTFIMYDVDNGSAAIAYGTLSPEETSADKTNTIEATGNVGLDTTLYGTLLCDNYPTCDGHTIAIAQQRYDASDIAWGSMTALLIDPGAELELNVGKTTTTGTPASAAVHWKLQIPAAQNPEPYSGENTIIGIVSESAGW